MDEERYTIGLGVDASDLTRNIKTAVSALSEYKATVDETARAVKFDPSNIDAQVSRYEALTHDANLYANVIDAIQQKQQSLKDSDPTATTSKEYQQLTRDLTKYQNQAAKVAQSQTKTAEAVRKAQVAEGKGYDELSDSAAKLARQGQASFESAQRLRNVDLTPVSKEAEAAASAVSKLAEVSDTARKTAQNIAEASNAAHFDGSDVENQVRFYDELSLSVSKFKNAAQQAQTIQDELLKSDSNARNSTAYKQATADVTKYTNQANTASRELVKQQDAVARAAIASGRSFDDLGSHVQEITNNATRAAAAEQRLRSVNLAPVAREAQSGANSLGILEREATRTRSQIMLLRSSFTQLFAANLASNAVMTGLGAVENGVSGIVHDLDDAQATWATFQNNLETAGLSADEIDHLKKKFQDYGAATIFSAGDMASAYAQLQAVGIKSADSIVTGFAGIASTASDPIQAMKSLTTQATQMAAKPKVEWQDFRIMMEQAPAGVANVAKAMGESTADLVKQVQAGDVKVQDFFDAVNKAGNSDALQKSATHFKNMDQAIQGATESLTNNLQPAWERIEKIGVSVINSISDKLDGIDWSASLDALLSIGSRVVSFFKSVGLVLSNAFKVFKDTGAIDATKGALVEVSLALGNLLKSGENGHLPILEVFTSALGHVITVVADAIGAVAEAISKMSPGQLKALQIAVVGLFGAITAFSVARFAFGGLAAAALSLKTFKETVGLISDQLGPIFGKIRKTTSEGIDAKAGAGLAGDLSTTSEAVTGLGTASEVATPKLATFKEAVGAGLGSLLKLGGVAVVALSVAESIKILIGAVVEASQLDWGDLGRGLVAVAGALALLVAGVAGMAAIGEAFGAGALMITPLIAVLDGLVFAFGYLLNAVTNAAQVIPQALGSIIPAFVQFYEGFKSIDWEEVFETFGKAIIDAVVGSLNAVTENGPQLVKAFVDMVVGMADAIGKNAGNIADGLAQAVIKAIKGVTKAIDDNYRVLFNAGQKLVDTVFQAIGYAVGRASFFEIGGYIVSGLWKGIQDKWSGTINGGFGKLVKGSVKWVRQLLGIHSPSRVFAEIGGYTVAGLAKGIGDNAHQVSKRLQVLVSDMVSTARSATPTITPELQVPTLKAAKISSIREQLQASLDSSPFAVDVLANTTAAATVAPQNITTNQIQIDVTAAPGENPQITAQAVLNAFSQKFA